MRILAIGFKFCGDDKLLRANLLNTAATIAEKQNRHSDAEEMFLECLRIRLNALPSDHAEVANSYNNLGKVYVTKRQYHKAIDLYQKAINIDMTKEPQDRQKILYIRHLNMATAYRFIGKSLVARQHLNEAFQSAREGLRDPSYYVAV